MVSCRLPGSILHCARSSQLPPASAARVAHGMEGFEEVLFEDVFGVLEAVLVSAENARAFS